ncbi:hypothetical protein [Candidatus Uabimicrobium amorphum]|uniref:Uncharacterized protein n=1 Tax=Uabimicrobium amorphum TaxID=2596890 RepID=A0A5S9II83_UABAM|nr:hypothetical protein [Candidatus Uabimicrobium amorphum]BBM82030.1 hypothetical protein UABAM_00373 [Candidatus Uabimicrobium amorphum]
MKNFVALVMALIICSSVWCENATIATAAKSLEFSGTWSIDGRSDETQILSEGNLLKSYNGSQYFPLGTKQHVADAKNFVNIIAYAECGYALPYGYDYATHAIEEVQPGYILQKSAPEPHTMIAVAVNGEEVKVLHSNWAAHHRVSYNTFTKSWLAENGFQVFKPGQDEVKDVIIIEDKNPQGRVLGSWRVQVTGTVPYHRISQGTIISHSGPGGQVRVNETRTVSNTFRTEAGVDAKVISAKVGFEVTASFSRSLQYWRDVSPGKYGYVDLYYKYMLKNFNVYYDPLIGSEYFVASGKAYKWQAVEFQYREFDN